MRSLTSLTEDGASATNSHMVTINCLMQLSTYAHRITRWGRERDGESERGKRGGRDQGREVDFRNEIKTENLFLM